MLITPLFQNNYQITTLISRSVFLTGRRPTKEGIGTRVINFKRGGSCETPLPRCQVRPCLRSGLSSSVPDVITIGYKGRERRSSLVNIVPAAGARSLSFARMHTTLVQSFFGVDINGDRPGQSAFGLNAGRRSHGVDCSTPTISRSDSGPVIGRRPITGSFAPHSAATDENETADKLRQFDELTLVSCPDHNSREENGLVN